MGISQCLRRAAQINGEGVATIFQDRQLTWREIRSRVAQLAGALQNLGLKNGGRVAILALNSDRYLEIYYAVAWAGGTFVPINPGVPISELPTILEHSDSEILFGDDTLRVLLENGGHQTLKDRHLIYIGENASLSHVLHYEEILHTTQPIPSCDLEGGDVACILYTSGTTGRPKGVMLTHDNLLWNALGTVATHKLEQFTVFLHTSSLYRVTGVAYAFIIAMIAGTHVLLNRVTPRSILEAIQTHRVSRCLMVPTLLGLLIDYPHIRNYDVSSLQRIFYGGAPMPGDVAVKVMENFPGCEFSQGYGMSEASPSITVLPPRYHTLDGPFAGKIRSVGQPAFQVEVRIANEDGTEASTGDVGEILTRGPNVMKGYWKEPELSAQVLHGGWLHTGDLGYMDTDGFLFLMDRHDDVIITAGNNVYSVEVEEVINKHPSISMCAVFGIPDVLRGEVVHAIVVPKTGHALTARQILRHCKNYMTANKCPRSVIVRTEPMPMNEVGKILKYRLREEYLKSIQS